MKEIYLAGGCFWGVQEVFREARGVAETTVGYANSNVSSPTYKQVCGGATGATEALRIRYDERIVSLHDLLDRFFLIIDPLSLNRQGGDVGTNYRTGVYFTDAGDKPVIDEVFAEQERLYHQALQVELLPLANFFDAEDYHQNYLRDNPAGYCHVDLKKHKMN